MHDVLLIDGDIPIYKCAFSAESNMSYFETDGKRIPVENIREARKLQKDSDIIKETRIAPQSVAIDNLEGMINRIKSKVPHKECIIVLSTSKKDVNKRTRIARQMPYKADRPPKPFHYAALRKHIIEELGAIEVEEGEADDYLGHMQTDKSVIASIDKDLLQIPGDHFNVDSNELITVSELGQLALDENNKLTGDGFKWFCAQCLLGDRTDAIQGIPYLRQAKVYQILTGAKTEKDCWERVVKEYKSNVRVPTYYEFFEPDSESSRMRYLKEMAQLVWIAHSEQDYYLPHINNERIV
jgi:5'-3' exonuclease